MMKNLIISLALIGLFFTSCTDISETVEDTPDTFNIYFDAKVIDPSTKATLTPNEHETAFAAAWEIGDAINLEAMGERFTAKWDGTSFVADVPTSLLDKTVCIVAYYPYEANDEYLSLNSVYRTQESSKYNSFYDFMSGMTDVTLTTDAKFVIPMERETSVLYFHLTSDQDISIQKAKLEFGGNRHITTTYTGLSSSNATLWFNILPGSYPMTLEIYAEGNKAATISTMGNEATYHRGKLYKVNKGIKWKSNVIEFMSYDYDRDSGITHTDDSDIHDVFSNGANLISSIDSVERIYPARNSLGGVKFGSASKVGSITFSLINPINATYAIITAATYSESEGQTGFTFNGINVNLSGTPMTYSDYYVPLDGSALQTVSIIRNKSDYGRFFIKSISLCDDDMPSLTQ